MSHSHHHSSLEGIHILRRHWLHPRSMSPRFYKECCHKRLGTRRQGDVFFPQWILCSMLIALTLAYVSRVYVYQFCQQWTLCIIMTALLLILFRGSLYINFNAIDYLHYTDKIATYWYFPGLYILICLQWILCSKLTSLSPTDEYLTTLWPLVPS